MNFFDTKNIAFQILDYPLSYVELIGTLFGFLSVYLATRANILTWATGIINEFFLFILFFQVQLYADMFLQIYFFIITLYGWYKWNSKKNDIKISTTLPRIKILLTVGIAIMTVISGILFSNIHLYLPAYFKLQAAYPFIDSFVMVASIVATFLLAKKKIESWLLWISIDLVGIGLYFMKGIYFLSFQYFIFFGLAMYGFFRWKKQMAND